jgi:hypothetical protein
VRLPIVLLALATPAPQAADCDADCVAALTAALAWSVEQVGPRDRLCVYVNIGLRGGGRGAPVPVTTPSQGSALIDIAGRVGIMVGELERDEVWNGIVEGRSHASCHGYRRTTALELHSLSYLSGTGASIRLDAVVYHGTSGHAYSREVRLRRADRDWSVVDARTIVVVSGHPRRASP